MGHSTLLDIIGSIVVGGLLFLMALQLNASASESSAAYAANFILQSNLVTLVVMIEDDFRRVGYCQNPMLIPSGTAITSATKDTFGFRTDVDNAGVVDIVRYYVGDSTQLNGEYGTPNPRDRYLYREVNSEKSRWNLGVTDFKFQYYRNDDPAKIIPFPIPIADLGTIGVVDLAVQLESPAPMHHEYMADTSQYQVYWRQIRMSSKNILYR